MIGCSPGRRATLKPILYDIAMTHILRTSALRGRPVKTVQPSHFDGKFAERLRQVGGSATKSFECLYPTSR